MTTPITPYTGTVPSRGQTQDVFDPAMSTFIAWWATVTTELNTAITAMNLNSTTDTSASSVAIGLGSKTFTVSASKSFVAGMSLVIADASAPSENAMFGMVTSYIGTTLIVDVDVVLGTGTIAAWTISQTASTAAARAAMVGRNLVIGGDFSTNPWQRGTSFTAPASATYTADRFTHINNTDGVINVLKTADAPTVAQAGIFTQHCLHVDVTTADATIAAGQICGVRHYIEGIRIKGSGFGQSGTRYVTISFWHKHTKTGTNCIAVRNSASDRSYVAEYTQSVTDTWEESSITVPVDTTGTWLYDVATVGLRLDFAVATGSTFHTTADTWTAGNYLSTANQVNNLDATSNNFKIDLVQVETGQVKTVFEDLDANEVKHLCYPYCQPVLETTGSRVAGAASSTTASEFAFVMPVPMIATPSVNSNAGSVSVNNLANGASGATTTPFVAVTIGSKSSVQIKATTTAGSPTLVAGNPVLMYLNSAVPLLLTSEL